MVDEECHSDGTPVRVGSIVEDTAIGLDVHCGHCVIECEYNELRKTNVLNSLWLSMFYVKHFKMIEGGTIKW